MLAKGFVQIIVPSRTDDGKARGPLRIGTATTKFPRSPHHDSIVVKIELDVDDSLLSPKVLKGHVPPSAATIVLRVEDNPGD